VILDNSNNSSEAAACNNKCFLLLSGCCSYSFRALVLNNPKLSEAKPFPIEKSSDTFSAVKVALKMVQLEIPASFPRGPVRFFSLVSI